MKRHTHTFFTLAASVVLASGCADDAGPVGDGDGDIDPYACEDTPVGGEPFAIELGLRTDSDTSFVALSDGDELPVVLGFQGLYMSTLELQAAMVAPADADQICFTCTAALGPGGSFEGLSQLESTTFTEEPDDLYTGFSTLLVGGQAQLGDGEVIDGLEVELTMACDGHGFTGSGQQTVRLVVSVVEF